MPNFTYEGQSNLRQERKHSADRKCNISTAARGGSRIGILTQVGSLVWVELSDQSKRILPVLSSFIIKDPAMASTNLKRHNKKTIEVEASECWKGASLSLTSSR